MKILFVHNRYQHRGGEDAVVEAEATLLQAKGHGVKVIEFDNDDILDFGSKVKAGLGAFYNVASARRLRRETLDFHPDVVHVHNLFFKASPSVIVEAKRLGLPVVLTVHNYRLLCVNALLLRDNNVCELCVNQTFPLYGIRYKCYRSSYADSALVSGVTGVHKVLHTWTRKIDTMITPSEFLKRKLLSSSLKMPAEKVLVKPNFIDDPGPNETGKEDFFLFVGRLSAEKGIDVLLTCFENDPSAKWIIAGDGPEREKLLQQIADKPNVRYAGPQPRKEIISLMKKSKALVFPSVCYEGLPMTIIEAFASSTPVIASNLGAMKEMIQDEKNGFLFCAGDSTDLQKCLERFVNLTAIEKKNMQREARLSYEKNYHPDVHYRTVLSIYENAITQNKK